MKRMRVAVERLLMLIPDRKQSSRFLRGHSPLLAFTTSASERPTQ
jgi:hypothetical protein